MLLFLFFMLLDDDDVRDDCLLLFKEFGVASSLIGFLLKILKLEAVEVEPLNGGGSINIVDD
jgi:hypothetical protein